MTLADDLVQVWAEDESGGVRGPMSLTALKALVDKGEVPQPFLYSYDGVTFEPAPEDLLIDLAVAESPAPEDFLVDDTIAETAHSPKPAAAAPPRSPPDGAPAKPAGPPPPPTPRAIQAAPPKGRMEQISALRLYYLIAAADAGGLLSLGEGPSEVKLWFKQGTPHAVQSSSQQLGPFLVEQRAVSPEAFKQAQAKSPADPILFLFTSGQLNPASVFPLVQQHSLAILQHALLLDHGPFTFDPSQPAPASGFPLGNRWEILVGAARRMDPLSLRKRLSGREKQAPRLTGSTADLKLAALELRLVSALDGRRALAELATGSAAEVETQQRMIVLLHELDRLTWEAASPQKPATTVAGSAKPAVAPPAATAKPAAGAPAAAAKPVTPAAGARPTAAAPAGAKPAGAAPAKPVAPKPAATPAAPAKPAAGPPAKKPDDPAKFLASLKDKNYFERLGLPKSDKAPPTLKATYLQFAKIYHPDMVASDAPPEEKKQRQDIQALLNEAYSVLSDDKRLKDYLDELATKEAGLDAAALEGILKAEEDFTRAIILIKGNKVREGLTMVEQCIKLNPKEGEFYAWRGYANFLYSTNKKAAFLGAIRDVEKCQQMSPRCVPAYLIEGNMAKLIGDDARAKKAFQKVVDLDPKNIDATRELRLYQSRKK